MSQYRLFIPEARGLYLVNRREVLNMKRQDHLFIAACVTGLLLLSGCEVTTVSNQLSYGGTLWNADVLAHESFSVNNPTLGLPTAELRKLQNENRQDHILGPYWANHRNDYLMGDLELPVTPAGGSQITITQSETIRETSGRIQVSSRRTVTTIKQR